MAGELRRIRIAQPRRDVQFSAQDSFDSAHECRLSQRTFKALKRQSKQSVSSSNHRLFFALGSTHVVERSDHIQASGNLVRSFTTGAAGGGAAPPAPPKAAASSA